MFDSVKGAGLMLQIQQLDRDGVKLVVLRGEAGVAEAPDMSALMIDLAASRPKKLVFELTGLTFISSMAMGEMAALAAALRRFECRLAVAGASSLIRGALRRFRLDRSYDLFDTSEVAITELNSQSPMWFVLKQPSGGRTPATP